MTLRRSPWQRGWRMAVMVLLLLGTLIRPMLTHVGELHGLEHASTQGAHGLHESAQDERGKESSGIAHTLLHQLDGCSGTAIVLADPRFLIELATATLLNPVLASRLVERISLLFRPPIGGK